MKYLCEFLLLHSLVSVQHGGQGVATFNSEDVLHDWHTLGNNTNTQRNTIHIVIGNNLKRNTKKPLELKVQVIQNSFSFTWRSRMTDLANSCCILNQTPIAAYSRALHALNFFLGSMWKLLWLVIATSLVWFYDNRLKRAQYQSLYFFSLGVGVGGLGERRISRWEVPQVIAHQLENYFLHKLQANKHTHLLW